jgi:hypothetical protein
MGQLERSHPMGRFFSSHPIPRGALIQSKPLNDVPNIFARQNITFDCVLNCEVSEVHVLHKSRHQVRKVLRSFNIGRKFIPPLRHILLSIL